MDKNIVLLINDKDPVFSRVASAKIRHDAGWNVEITTNYDEALSLVKAKNPDVIVTEIMLNDDKGRSGFDLIKEIRSDSNLNKCIIVVLTDLSQDSDRDLAISTGANHYFVKSQLSLKGLIEEVKKIIS